MVSLAARCTKIVKSVIKSPTQLPGRVIIPASHVNDGKSIEAFDPKKHYFKVVINEMFLANRREWVKDYYPMVFVVSEFIYRGQKERLTVPFVVGPSMLAKYNMTVPEGMVFSDTCVAGPHPYRGDAVTLSVILYKISQRDYARQLLQIVENTVGALDLSTALSTYLKIAGPVLDGVEALLGLDDTVPVIGWSKGFDKPCHVALINLPETQVNPNELWVRDNQLFKGTKPFREADYVLYSLVPTTSRDDVMLLPFYDLHDEVIKSATGRTKREMKEAEAKMFTLSQAMLLSPDLTLNQAERLWEEYDSEMRTTHKMAVSTAPLGPEEERAMTELDRQLQKTFSILKL